MALPCASKLRNVKCFLNTLFHRPTLVQVNYRACSSVLMKRLLSSQADSPSQHEHRVFSGIQPTGIPHLGNYAGAICTWLKLQKKFSGRMMLSIVDLHSITIPQDPSLLRQNILDMTACLLACGIDPDKVIVFQQSMVPFHVELAWILACLCSVPRLQRLPQWKEKKSTLKDPSVGLLTYPILQAADIMLYRSSLVPVGEDQTQHLELTRDLCKAFNRSYKPVFPICETVAGELPKIHSLRNPDKKMSKSEADVKSRIELLDSDEDIRMKIKKAVTDFTSEISYDPQNRPGVSNLIEIHLAVSHLSCDEIVEDSFLRAEDTAQYKSRLAEAVIEKLSPIRSEVLRYRADPDYLLKVLVSGAEKATVLAESTMKEVRECVGLR